MCCWIVCEKPVGNGGGVNPNFVRYSSCAAGGAMPSNSDGVKLKTAIVPSDETAYKVRPSEDLRGDEYIYRFEAGIILPA